jgi:hypothetical protein
MICLLSLLSNCDVLRPSRKLTVSQQGVKISEALLLSLVGGDLDARQAC